MIKMITTPLDKAEADYTAYLKQIGSSSIDDDLKDALRELAKSVVIAEYAVNIKSKKVIEVDPAVNPELYMQVKEEKTRWYWEQLKRHEDYRRGLQQDAQNGMKGWQYFSGYQYAIK